MHADTFHFAVFLKPKKQKLVKKVKAHNIPNALQLQLDLERRGNPQNHFLEPEPLQDDSNDMTKEDEGREEGTKTVFVSKEGFEIEKYKDEILSWFETESSMVDFSNKVTRSRYGINIRRA